MNQITTFGSIMKRLFLFALLLSLSYLHAAVYKGRTAYIGFCKDCHGNGTTMAKRYKSDQWRDFLNNKGKELAKLHIETPKMQSHIKKLQAQGLIPYTTVLTVQDYFLNRSEKLNNSMTRKEKKAAKRRIFQYQSRHLRDFFVEFAKDSGKVPACSDDNPEQTKEQIELAKKIAEAERLRREKIAEKRKVHYERTQAQKNKQKEEAAKKAARAVAAKRAEEERQRKAKAAKLKAEKEARAKAEKAKKKPLTTDQKILQLVKGKLSKAEMRQLKTLLKQR